MSMNGKTQNTNNEQALVAATQNLPDYVTPGTIGEGADEIEVTNILPRIRAVQGMTDQTIKNEFGEGAMFLSPDGILIAPKGGSIRANIIFPFRSWFRLRDINDPSPEGPIMDYTIDPNSELARVCSSPHHRTETYDNGRFTARNVASYDFVVMLDSPVAGQLAIVSFNRGGWKIGSTLRDRIRQLGHRHGYPVYAHIIELSAQLTSNRTGKSWWQITWKYVGAAGTEMVEECRRHYREMKAAYETMRIRADDPETDTIE